HTYTIRTSLTTNNNNCMFFFSSRRRHTRSKRDWSSDVCSSDLTKEERKIDFDYVQNIPIIKDSLASIACDVYESYPVGDHTLYIGKDLHVACKEDTPLTFFGGQYGLYQPVQ